MPQFRSVASHPLEFAGHAGCQGPVVEYSLAYIKLKKKLSVLLLLRRER